MNRIRNYINTALAAIVIFAATAGMVYLIGTKPAASQVVGAVRSPEVIIFPVNPVLFQEPVIGFGTVRAKNHVKIIPQVTGALVDMHADLEVGNIIPAGEVLYRIDRRAYESQKIQVQAQVQMLEAQLKRHDRDEQSLSDRLTNARQQLAIAESNYSREEKLTADAAGIEAEVDAARLKVLQSTDVVLNLQSQLELVPILREETAARLDARKAQLADAERDLLNTDIACPFDARVDAVSARTPQSVMANFAIAALTDISALELAAVLDPVDLQWLDNQGTVNQAHALKLGDEIADAASVEVTWALGDQIHSWTGRVSRLESLDEATRTARLVVEIPQSLEVIREAEASGHIPLSIGMFCSARIPAAPLADALVLPRSSVHEDNMVYVLEQDEDGSGARLALRRVPILRSMGELVLVDFAGRSDDARLSQRQASAVCELKAGDLVVSSPLPRAVEGMEIRIRSAQPAVDPVDVITAWSLDRTPEVLSVPAALAQHSPASSFLSLNWTRTPAEDR